MLEPQLQSREQELLDTIIAIIPYLNIKDLLSLFHVSRNFNLFFKECEDNKFKEFVKFSECRKFSNAKVGNLMFWAKQDPEIAKIIIKSPQLFKKINCSKNDYNIIRLAKSNIETAEAILRDDDIIKDLKAPLKTKEKINNWLLSKKPK